MARRTHLRARALLTHSTTAAHRHHEGRATALSLRCLLLCVTLAFPSPAVTAAASQGVLGYRDVLGEVQEVTVHLKQRGVRVMEMQTTRVCRGAYAHIQPPDFFNCYNHLGGYEQVHKATAHRVRHIFWLELQYT